MQEQIGAPGFYDADYDEAVAPVLAAAAMAEAQLDEITARWLALTEKAEALRESR